MNIDYNQHSLWLSYIPCIDDNGENYGDGMYNVPPDYSFFYLGGRASFSYSISYSGTATGIPSQDSSQAVYVDSASGCVANIDIKTVRVQEPTYSDDILVETLRFGVCPKCGHWNPITNTECEACGVSDLTEKIIYGYDANNCSNAKVVEYLRQMKNTMQLKQGAYILRVYNQRQKVSGQGSYVDFPVYLDTYSANTDMDAPNITSITLRLIRRGPRAGQEIGLTVS